MSIDYQPTVDSFPFLMEDHQRLTTSESNLCDKAYVYGEFVTLVGLYQP